MDRGYVRILDNPKFYYSELKKEKKQIKVATNTTTVASKYKGKNVSTQK